MNRTKAERLAATISFVALPLLVSGQGIRVYVDSRAVAFPVGQPMEWKGHVMVPLRGVFERLGGTVDWDQAAQRVTINKGTTTIKITVGEAHALKNEETIVIPTKAILRTGTAYVPLRFLAESLDAKVHWDGGSRTVRITQQKSIPPPH